MHWPNGCLPLGKMSKDPPTDHTDQSPPQRRVRKLADGYSRIALPPALADELRAEQRRSNLGIAELVQRCLDAYRRAHGLPTTSLLLMPPPPEPTAAPTVAAPAPETDKDPAVGISTTLPAAQSPGPLESLPPPPDPADPPLQEMAYAVACRRLDVRAEPIRSPELAALLELWDFASLRDESRQLDVFMHWIEQHLATRGDANPRSILLGLHKIGSMPSSSYRWSEDLIVNEWRNAR